MNNLIEMSSEMTMSTRDIAEMLGARHADIIKSVCRLHDAGAICHDTTLPFREVNYSQLKQRVVHRDRAARIPDF